MVQARAARYVALLKGINVGKAHRVPMAALRSLLEGLGYASVRTLLNSGNAVFAAGPASDHGARIRAALGARLGVDVAVVVKDQAEMEAIAAECPIRAWNEDPSQLLVAFTAEAGALAGLAPLEELVTPPERFLLGRHAAYLGCADGILACRAADALLGRAGRSATTRSAATLAKLMALLGEAEPRKARGSA